MFDGCLDRGRLLVSCWGEEEEEAKKRRDLLSCFAIKPRLCVFVSIPDDREVPATFPGGMEPGPFFVNLPSLTLLSPFH